MINQKKNWLEISLILCIFLAALFIRLSGARASFHYGYQFVMGDDDDYHRLAISVLTTGSLVDNGVYAYRMPVFPLFLASIYFVVGPDPNLAMIVMIVISSLTCVGVYWLGRRWFGPATGFIAGFLCAMDLDLAINSQFLLTETLTVALVLVALILFEHLMEKPDWKFAFMAGILLALLVMLRVNYGVFVLIALAWFLWNHRARFRSVLPLAILIIGIVGTACMLWVGRNYLVLGAFIPFTTQAGNGYYGVYNDSAANCQTLKECGYWINITQPDYPQGSNEVQRDQVQRKLAWEWIRSHPTKAVGLAFTQIIHLWRPLWEMDWVIYILAIIGLALTPWQKMSGPKIWALLACALSLTAVLTIAVERFRFPLHPWLDIMAAYALIKGINFTGWLVSRSKGFYVRYNRSL